MPQIQPKKSFDPELLRSMADLQAIKVIADRIRPHLPKLKSEVQRKVLKLRYGIPSGKPLTTVEIAKKLGRSKQGIHGYILRSMRLIQAFLAEAEIPKK